MGIFKIVEFESVLKFEMPPFLVGVGPIFARKLAIIRERWVVRIRRFLRRFSRRILRKDREPLQKF